MRCLVVINGFVLPRMEHYLVRLGRYAEANRRALYVMGSNGGIMTAETAARYPVRTILSGPAGGVNGALLACRQANVPDFITCDMGGTSTDVSLVQALTPTRHRPRTNWIEDFTCFTIRSEFRPVASELIPKRPPRDDSRNHRCDHWWPTS